MARALLPADVRAIGFTFSMNDHLRFAGAEAATQYRVLRDIIADDPMLMHFLHGLAELALPDPLLGSGAIYNTVWNVLTRRPRHAGIKDADLVYFDALDRSYEAEDRIIKRVQSYFSASSIPPEVRNQARVHLWFPQKFGLRYPELKNSADMLNYFATKTHAVAARLEAGRIVSLRRLVWLIFFRSASHPTRY